MPHHHGNEHEREENEHGKHAATVKHNQDLFDKKSKNLDKDLEYQQSAKESYEMIKETLGASWSANTTTVLNFGCGTGNLESYLRNDVHHITGLDVSRGMIDRFQAKIEAKGWSDVTAVQGDILETSSCIPLETGSFDLIVSCFVFHHLQDITSVGKALMRYLKPNGKFCLIAFASEKEGQSERFTEKMDDATKASLGPHAGFADEFLTSFFQEQLALSKVRVMPARPMKYAEDSFPTVLACGQRLE